MCVRNTAFRTALLLSVFCLPGGCSWFDSWMQKPTTRPFGTMSQADEPAAPTGPAFDGTVGSVVYLEGHRPLRVQGYGLVTRLNGQGGRNCPPSIRDQLIKEIRRYRSAHPEIDRDLPPAEDVIDSLDTAVVVVTGEIPAGAAKQRTFDLFVTAMDPDTKTLAGGFLLPCDLRVYRDEGPAGSMAGKLLARAQGPVFMNPFATGGGTTVNLREGRIIGGGSNLEGRDLLLISTIESYSTVRQVQDAINRRFPEEKHNATAVTPTNITLKVPADYQGKEGKYLEIVLALPLTMSTLAMETKAKELAGELTRPEAPLHKVGLALEGIGASVLPIIQPLYTHPRKPVNYYAARTGMRLGDRLAIEVIARHARDERSPVRREAIIELGDAKPRERATAALLDLLADTDPQIRILAYESIRRAAPDTVYHVTVGKDPVNFVLELVQCEGEPLIYARRTQTRRIALIGGDRMMCKPPLLLAEPGSPVVLSAQEGDPAVSIVRKDHSGKTMLGPLKAPLNLSALIRFLGQRMLRNSEGRVEGLDLEYAVILDVLYRLSEKKAINAQFKWEEPSVEDLLGPLAPAGRPESEL